MWLCRTGNGMSTHVGQHEKKAEKRRLLGEFMYCGTGNGTNKPISIKKNEVILKCDIILYPSTDFLLFDLSLSIQHFCWSCHCQIKRVFSPTFIKLLLFASGRCLLSLFSFTYRNCVSRAPFSLPVYHQLRIPLLFTVCSPSLWAAQWWSSCADYYFGDFQTLLLVFSTSVGNSRAKAEISLGE